MPSFESRVGRALGRFQMSYRRRQALRRRNAPISSRPSTINAKIKRVLNNSKEQKSHCYDLGPTSLVSGTWDINSPDKVPQGDGSENRDGDELYVKSLVMRYGFTSATDRIGLIRTMVIKWKNSYANIAGSDLPADAYSCIDSTMRSKYTVLYDQVTSFSPRTTGAAEDSVVKFKQLYLPLKHVVKFRAATTAVPSQGAIYVCFLHGTNYGSGTDDPEVDGEIQYNFVEK